MRMLAFDCPAPDLDNFEFEIRARTTTFGISSDHPFLISTTLGQVAGREGGREGEKENEADRHR